MVSDKTRRDAFIEQNLGLVHACAGRFRGRGIEYDDLYSAGCMGLVKACDNFDESRGVCFSTYAVPGQRHSQGEPLLKRIGDARTGGTGASHESVRYGADPFSAGGRIE